MRSRAFLLVFGLVLLPVFIWWIWRVNSDVPLLADALRKSQTTGKEVLESLTAKPALALTKDANTYQVKDDLPEGIQITYPSEKLLSQEADKLISSEAQSSKYTLTFPETYTDPIKVTLPGDKSFSFRDTNGKDTYRVETLSDSTAVRPLNTTADEPLLAKLFPKASEQKYLRYTDASGRKSLYYAYHKDAATGERELKHWTIYEAGTGEESESYSFEEALLKKNEDGSVSVYYTDPNQLKNQEGAAGVDTNLLERAQRVLAADQLESQEPDATIPAPYVLDKDGEKHDLSWEVSSDQKSLTVTISVSSFAQQQSSSQAPSSFYPLALDPTLSFTAPSISNTGDTITGEVAGDNFGVSMTTGDFNADGKMDLAVGAHNYNPGGAAASGRIYVFYNDGSITSMAQGADVAITGEGTTQGFGVAVFGADLNNDSKIDLIVGSRYGGAGAQGRAYIFYNDGSYPASASGADVKLTGISGNDTFSNAFAVGDFNSDGKTDLVVGANQNAAATYNGIVYIFYNANIVTQGAAAANITITGESNSYFGTSLTTGDFNANGTIDLAVGAYAGNGKAYIFYNDGSIPTTAATADVIISGENSFFGYSIQSGDFNFDGKIDLVVGANVYNSYIGRAYIFYADGTNNFGTATCTGTPAACSAANADVIITGIGGAESFSQSLAVGDFNSDGRTDLVVGALNAYGGGYGKAYIFYNDGSYPATAATADVMISGENTSSYFGSNLCTGDLNSDGKTDLVVGAYNYASSRGKAYVFYSQNGQVNTNQSITGGASGDKFGQAMTTGDVNADGRIDLIIGAPEYNPGGALLTGRVYVFYGDGQIPTTAATADVTITGEATSNYFGLALTVGDFNADGTADLAAGSHGYSTSSGRAYIFYNGSIITENASGADIVITGETLNNYFGYALTSGDFNADGKTDLASGAYRYNSYAGRVYIFYNGSIITENASGADAIITGDASYEFGSQLITGDFNTDGKMDLAVGSSGFSSATGIAFIFYNDGSYPASASSAEVYWIGQNFSDYFGASLSAGDFNSDGRTDLAVGAYGYSTSAGRAYIFYNDGSYPASAASADVIISGEASSKFGRSLVSGDFNADGRADLAVGGDAITSNTGKSYIFYNDGGIPTTAATADVAITGEATSNYFGYAMTAGDMNGDGRTDLIVGAYGYSTNTGRVYIYETRENFAWQLEKVSGTPASGGLRVAPNVSGEEMKMSGRTGDELGRFLISGDFNADGKTDLAVGAPAYVAAAPGRVYIFYNDGSLPADASSADVMIVGETNGSAFGWALTAGDFNADGRIDIGVGAWGYSSGFGRAYIFYNDGTYPATAASADVIIGGEASGSQFGDFVSAGDLNADGKTDFIVGSTYYSTSTGRVYIFYNDSSYPTVAASADVFITGETTNNSFGSLMTGDFNADGKTDLVVGAYYASSSAGRAYVFYSDGTNNFGTATCSGTPASCSAANADAIMTGEGGYFSRLTAGDFNADGKTDLAVGAGGYGSNVGRVYLFYNGSITTEAATGADVIITGEATTGYFGQFMTAGDWNSDGRMDLAVSAYAHTTNTGRVYLFYNDGSIPATAATADLILIGETTSSSFGSGAFTSGDWNSDGKTDLAIGAYEYSSSKGRLYVYTFNDTVITGGATDYFGYALVSGDFNADGKTDLAVGATRYSTNQGKTYIFYNDGAYPAAAGSADATITGESSSNYFGAALAAADMNYDGKTDLIVGAYGHNTNVGRAYIFYNGSITTENASGGDVIITGEAGSLLGYALGSGDFNADGRVDLVAGSVYSGTGRAYLFYNDGSIPTTGAAADVIFTGQANSSFSQTLASGDFNSDGKTDLVIGGSYYNNNYVGRVYLYYADGTNNYGTAVCSGTPAICAATDADVIIEGQSGITGSFGYSFAVGDFNTDGRTDLAVGAKGSAVYIFYNDGSYPTSYAQADVAIVQESAGDEFGWFLLASDLNADGRTDLVVDAKGATYYSNTGRVYIFYNDGTYPTSAGSADVILDGELYSYFGTALASGDFNTDGNLDLAIGAYQYGTNTGRVYLIINEVSVENLQTNTAKLRGTGRLRGSARLR